MTTENLNVETTVEAPANTFALAYHFKRMDKTDANIAKLTKGFELKAATLETPATTLAKDCKFAVEEIKDEAGQVLATKIKRESEFYTLPVPKISDLGLVVDQADVASVEQASYLQHLMEEAIYKLGRPLVDQGIELTAENCNWSLAVKAGLSSRGTGGSKKASSGISKELLFAAADSFKEYLEAIGKPAAGIEAMVKMVKARMSANTTAKYINGLPMVSENLENWIADGCTEEEQEVFGVVAVDMISRIEETLKPKEDTSELF